MKSTNEGEQKSDWKDGARNDRTRRRRGVLRAIRRAEDALEKVADAQRVLDLATDAGHFADLFARPIALHDELITEIDFDGIRARAAALLGEEFLDVEVDYDLALNRVLAEVAPWNDSDLMMRRAA